MSSDGLRKSAFWRAVFPAAMALRRSPDPVFAELGQALLDFHVRGDRDALADALVDIGRRMKGGG